MIDRKELLIRFSIMIFFALGLALLIWSRQILLMALIGIGFAVIIDPAIIKLKEVTHLPRSLSTLIFYLGFILFLLSVVALIVYISADQYKSLSKELPKYLKGLEMAIGEHAPNFGSFDKLFEDADLTSSIKDIVGRLYKISRSIMTSFSGIALSLIASFYLSLNYSFYSKQLSRMISGYPAREVTKVSGQMAQTLRAWFRAQLTDMICVAILMIVGLWIVGFKYWLVIGLLAGLVGIIPYLGIMVISVLASIIAAAQDPAVLPWVLLVFFVTQQIEGNFILPYLMKKEVSLPGFPLIIFLFLMGFWLGVLGAIMAAPLLALIIELININRSPENYILKRNHNEK
jgi:predicted PurR-regulated permease PerM